MNRFVCSASTIIFACCLASTNLAFAQQEGAEAPHEAGGVSGIIGGILDGIGADAGSSIQIEAISDDGSGPVRVFSFGDAGGMTQATDPMSLLGLEQIKKELELVEEQEDQLRSIRSELNSKMSARMRQMFQRDGGRPQFDREAMAKWKEEM